MPGRRPINRKILRVAAILMAVGVLFIAVGAFIDGEWPTGMGVLGPCLGIAALLVLWYSEKDQRGGPGP